MSFFHYERTKCHLVAILVYLEHTKLSHIPTYLDISPALFLSLSHSPAEDLHKCELIIYDLVLRSGNYVDEFLREVFWLKSISGLLILHDPDSRVLVA